MADKSYLEMSDAELMAYGPVDATTVNAASTNDDAGNDENLDADMQASSDAVEAAATESNADETDDTDGEGKDESGAADANSGVASTEDDDAAKAGVADKTNPTDKTVENVDENPAEGDKKPEEVAVDYQAEYNRLLAPFKANGKDIQIGSVDDAISLMKMGANYHKKMAGMKPHLKVLKMLEQNQLMDTNKLSFLIDLDKKNPDAINKLLKDSGIDPMGIDTDKAGDYKPNSYTVDDRELNLDEALDDIQDTPSYNRTLDILGTKWDRSSKQVIAESPQLVKVINDHVQSGIYDQIANQVERERMLGRLQGLSDIEAYRQIGDAIHAQGGFNKLVQQPAAAPTTPVIVQPKPKPAQDDKLRAQKLAAGGAAPAASAKADQTFNPLSLSDEDFFKISDERFK